MPDDTPASSASTPAPASTATAPAAPSTPAPAPADTAAPSSAVADAAGAESPSPWDPTSFEWDSWDGTTYDPFPEEVRPLAEQFGTFYSSKQEKVKAEHDRLQTLYDALIAGDEDPRIGEFTSKYEQEAAARAKFEEDYKGLRSEYDGVVQFVLDREATRAEQEATAFQQQHAWLFSGKYDDVSIELLDAGFPFTSLPELVKLPDSVRSTAKELLAKVKDPATAIRVAKAESQVPPPAGTEAFVAGSTSPAPAARTTEKPNPASQSGNDKLVALVKQKMAALQRR